MSNWDNTIWLVPDGGGGYSFEIPEEDELVHLAGDYGANSLEEARDLAVRLVGHGYWVKVCDDRRGFAARVEQARLGW